MRTILWTIKKTLTMVVKIECNNWMMRKLYGEDLI